MRFNNLGFLSTNATWLKLYVVSKSVFLNNFAIIGSELTPFANSITNLTPRWLLSSLIETTPLIMDTKFASIAGMCYDEVSKDLNSYVAIDIGNGHTTAASIENGKIQGVFEHHTSNLTAKSLEKYIKRLASGEITNEEIYADHGHGAHVLNPISKLEKVIVSGPKRELIEKTNLDWHHAAPGGDVMMTGTVGLIKTILGW